MRRDNDGKAGIPGGPGQGRGMGRSVWKAQDSVWAGAQESESRPFAREGSSQPMGWPRHLNLPLETRKLKPRQLIMGLEE